MSLVVLAIENHRWCRRSYVHNCDFWSKSWAESVSKVVVPAPKSRRVIPGKLDRTVFFTKIFTGRLSPKLLTEEESHCDRCAEISKQNVYYRSVLQNIITVFWLFRFRFWALHYWLKLSVETIAFRLWLRKEGDVSRKRLKTAIQFENLAL